MDSSLRVNSYSPSFGIKVNNRFVKSAHNYFNGVEYRPWRAGVFDNKVDKVTDEFGYDEFEIVYEKLKKGNKTSHQLYAVRDDLRVLLTSKDQFRKTIEKFMRLTKGELYIKIKQAKAEQGIV